MDMAVAEDIELSDRRLDELIRWHGTDESDLPPPHTLQHLSRDTVAALNELLQSRHRLQRLRAALGRAFWADSAQELHAIVLEALGPPPEPSGPIDVTALDASWHPSRLSG
jgi:hypothetical protein